MASDIFLKILGVEGESTDAKHAGEIEILSYSWGIENDLSIGSGGGGAGSGKATFQDFHFVSRLQKSSPKLFQACATGEHYKEAVISVRKAGGNQEDFYKISLNQVFVTSILQTASATSQESVPLEEINLKFGAAHIEYRQQNQKGALNPPVIFEWDTTTNTDT